MRKLTNILVPVDFTPHADNSLRYAATLAQHLPNARLLILHTCHIPAAVTGAGSMALAPYYEEELIESAKKKFMALEKQLLLDSSVPYEFICEYGPAVPDICEKADKGNIDLIILPAHPGSPLQEYTGNVTTATIRSSKVPVLVVPPGAEFVAPQTLVLAYDCKDLPEEAMIDALKPWHKHFKPQLHLLHSNHDPHHMPSEKTNNLLTFKAILHKFTPALKVIDAPETEGGIINYVQNIPASMLVIIPRKHNPVYHLLNKSISHKLAFHTPVPMLVLV